MSDKCECKIHASTREKRGETMSDKRKTCDRHGMDTKRGKLATEIEMIGELHAEITNLSRKNELLCRTVADLMESNRELRVMPTDQTPERKLERSACGHWPGCSCDAVMPDKPKVIDVYRGMCFSWVSFEEERPVILDALKLAAVLEHPRCIQWIPSKGFYLELPTGARSRSRFPPQRYVWIDNISEAFAKLFPEDV